MKIGVMQGRLSPPAEGFQECPVNWRREFDVLADLGLSHIDWVVTKNSFATNPFFFERLSKYSINAVCADNLVDRDILDEEYFKRNMVPICRSAIRNRIKNITIPLLEESDMLKDKDRERFIELLLPLVGLYEDLDFSFEAELEAKNF